MDDVGQKIVVLQSVVRINSFVVDGKGPGSDTSFVLSCGMGSELPCENIEDFLADPPSFGECCEREVVRVDFPEAWNVKIL